MSIDNFILQYTNSEVEKIERKDVVNRVQQKIQLQKAVTGANAAIETSPVRNPQGPGFEYTNSPRRSPGKKIIDYANVSPSRQVTNRLHVRSPKKKTKSFNSPNRKIK